MIRLIIAGPLYQIPFKLFPADWENTGRQQGLSETNKWLNTAMFYWHLIAERKERKI